MQINARLFAVLRDKAGTDSLVLEVTEGCTAAQASASLLDCLPQLRPFADAAMLAVNLEYVEPTHVMRAGDELALIPPVSGG